MAAGAIGSAAPAAPAGTSSVDVALAVIWQTIAYFIVL